MPSYHRVIPRDLFNEANFLKCLGQLSLLVHNWHGRINNVPYSIEYDGKPFDLDQDECGRLYCKNFRFYCDGEEVELSRPLNCREPWPLYGEYKGEEYYIFNDDGEYQPNFGHPDYEWRGHK